ncbi:MAG: hypothetical protein OEX10_06170 [Candidatus Bathyarchaeota archaeon]|nr:hypothetical protein [Candidatus Bathyarchaeota archaeon]MDH5664129.1 hypothetical protein [Candidatus Bathyarchaeota archaeon]
MPIDKEEFQNGKISSSWEEEIISFLNDRKEDGFTSQEIMMGTNYHADFATPEVAMISTFAIADFTNLLHDLVRRGRIRMKVVRDRMYFTAGGDGVAKCPKCKLEITPPRKTWKMAGRPDKKGKRLELQIGLYDCPKHGAFRSVLSKRKI